MKIFLCYKIRAKFYSEYQEQIKVVEMVENVDEAYVRNKTLQTMKRNCKAVLDSNSVSVCLCIG